MRLFIAINFPEKVKETIKNSTHFLTLPFPQMSWTKTDNLHLTLKFLGNIRNKVKSQEDNLLPQIKKEVERSIEGIRPFKLKFGNLGFFEREQLIVWLGVTPTPNLLCLADKIEQGMKKLGWDREKRPYSAHVTLGRGKQISKDVAQKIKKTIQTSQKINLLPFLVSEINLMQSELTPSGPIYTPLEKFALR